MGSCSYSKGPRDVNPEKAREKEEEVMLALRDTAGKDCAPRSRFHSFTKGNSFVETVAKFQRVATSRFACRTRQNRARLWLR